MPKIIVVIENTEDGQPIWDEASVKQLHDIIRPGTKPNHHGKRDDYGDVLPHYSSHQHKTDGDNQNRGSAAAGADESVDDELNPDLAPRAGKYQFEA